MPDERIIHCSDWRPFDPQKLDAEIAIDAAGIDFAAVYTWQAEHGGTPYQFLGCRPRLASGGKAVFDLGSASLILSAPAGWIGNPLWPPEREDQPPG